MRDGAHLPSQSGTERGVDSCKTIPSTRELPFAFSADGAKIRANQWHSAMVDLALQAAKPPDRLCHGTVTAVLASVSADGVWLTEN